MDAVGSRDFDVFILEKSLNKLKIDSGAGKSRPHRGFETSQMIEEISKDQSPKQLYVVESILTTTLHFDKQYCYDIACETASRRRA